jgi:hypothetical protein
MVRFINDDETRATIPHQPPGLPILTAWEQMRKSLSIVGRRPGAQGVPNDKKKRQGWLALFLPLAQEPIPSDGTSGVNLASNRNRRPWIEWLYRKNRWAGGRVEQMAPSQRQNYMIEILISSVFALVALASVAGIMFVVFKPRSLPGVCIR